MKLNLFTIVEKKYFPLISRRKISPQSLIMLAAGSHLFKGKRALSNSFPDQCIQLLHLQIKPAADGYDIGTLRANGNSRFFFLILSFCCSSTFKDAEQASLRDSGHGDSDQADSDQDTNKGSHCDTSAREALKMKATAVNGQPFEQGEWMHSLPDILKMPNALFGSYCTFLYTLFTEKMQPTGV